MPRLTTKEFNDREQALCEAKGREFIELPVAHAEKIHADWVATLQDLRDTLAGTERRIANDTALAAKLRQQIAEAEYVTGEADELPGGTR